MKSKKAEEFNPNTEKNRQLLISAIQGEEKMREKAIKAFCQTVCGGLGEDCKTCSIVKTFIEELNN